MRIVILAALASLLYPFGGGAQSLSELAAKEKARRKDVATRRARVKTLVLTGDPGPSSAWAEPVTTRTSSSIDAEWQRALAFEPRVAALSNRLKALEGPRRRYAESCLEKYTVQTAEPIDPLLPPPVWVEANETTAVCRMLLSDIEEETRALRVDREALRDDARRERILPGHLREIERKHGVDSLP